MLQGFFLTTATTDLCCPRASAQTLAWRTQGHGGRVVDGLYAGDDREFEVEDGLLSTRFKYSMFASATPKAEATPAEPSGSQRPAAAEPETPMGAYHRRRMHTMGDTADDGGAADAVGAVASTARWF